MKNKLLNSIATWVICAVLFGITGWFCYSFQPSWDFAYGGTWWILWVYVSLGIMMIVAPFVSDRDYFDSEETFMTFMKTLLVPLILAVVTLITIAIMSICNGAMTSSNKYFAFVKDRVTVTNESVLPDIIGEDGDTSKIAIIEDTEAFKKANAVLAEGSLGNKNSINEESLTSQEINGKFIYTLSLQPNSWFKWEGKTKGYITIDRNTGETNLIKDEFVYSIDAKYGNLIFHGTDNVKKLLISTYGGKWVDIDMELNDDSKPYWVATKVTQSGVGGYTKVLQVATVDPFTGETKTYNIGEEPEWIERVYPEDVMLEYLGYYGKYIHGWVNSWKTGNDVLDVTEGYNIVYIDGTPHVWTGLTTHNASNNASVGVAICNLKTGKITIYKNSGISEQHAQNSAMGLVQEKGYNASFPVILNINGETSYFMLLRDDNSNVQGYAFVSYKDYTKAAFGTTVKEALVAYKSKLNTTSSTEDMANKEELSTTGIVTAIGSEVVDGRTVYYVKIEGSDKVFSLQSGVNIDVVFLKLGDTVTFKYYKTNAVVVSVNAMSIN